MNKNNLIPKLLWITIFGIAMAYVEAAVVVYLRAIFRPEGFQFPMNTMTDFKIKVEVFREAATLFMLLSVAFLAGKKSWEKFAYFTLAFAVWDIFYYVWLKVLLDWPASIFDRDILFLIPVPWIGPVIAPVSVSLLLIVLSIMIAHSINKGCDFKPTFIPKMLALAGIAVILYSFICDTGATLQRQIPKPYMYELLIIGDGLFAAAIWISCPRERVKS
ncbi:MAG: hypothetical protein HZA14_02700 [Nitrospirae bacterium]|nr:hypothetical protein [Nitrospirota bacterium]